MIVVILRGLTVFPNPQMSTISVTAQQAGPINPYARANAQTIPGQNIFAQVRDQAAHTADRLHMLSPVRNSRKASNHIMTEYLINFLYVAITHPAHIALTAYIMAIFWPDHSGVANPRLSRFLSITLTIALSLLLLVGVHIIVVPLPIVKGCYGG
jgi:hypothetical protein